MSYNPDVPVRLWEASGFSCVLIRHSSAPSFEITISLGTDVVKREIFDHDEDAAAYAIAERGLAQREGGEC